jgi:voltage-gated potassium channel
MATLRERTHEIVFEADTAAGRLAVPTGIVSAELARRPRSVSTQACPDCAAEGHEPDSTHCRFCGAKL